MSRQVLIIGTGHNGLVAACYLARAGHSVTMLERRDFVGGACVTEELFPGFRASSCAYLCHMLQDRVVEDLELGRHGLEMLELDPVRFSPFPDGQHLLFWHDQEKTIESIARMNPADGEGYRRWMDFWDVASDILYRHFWHEPPPAQEVLAGLSGREAQVFQRVLTGSIKDLVEEHFQHPHVRTAFTDAQDSGDITAPGSILSLAYMRTGRFCDHKNFGIPRGGMGSITQAMANCARSLGVTILTDTEVEKVVVEDGRVKEVRTADRVFQADIYLSNADPRTTVRLVPDLPPDFQQRVKDLKAQAAYLKFHAAVNELPDFTRWLGEGFDPKWLAYTRICPSVEYYQTSWRDAAEGRPSSCPVMLMQLPSIHDPDLTPPGKHVVSVWVMYAPVEADWESLRGPTAEALIDRMTEYAPNFRRSLIDYELFTPLDIERRVGLSRGSIRHLDMGPDQMLGDRLSYRTPLKNLYLCGAGTHPGGEVSGANGYNAAQVVLAHA